MTRLYLVRHGEATGDGADPGLSPLGVSQCRLLGDRLRGEGAVEVRHSPRRRAVETAALLGELCGTPRAVDPLLDDRTPVPAPGEEELYPDRMRAWFDDVSENEQDPGGAHLSAAVEVCLADDRPLVLVTHAFVVAWFVQQVLGGPVSAWTLIAADNAGMTTIDRRPGRPPRLTGVNDVGHLHRLSRDSAVSPSQTAGTSPPTQHRSCRWSGGLFGEYLRQPFPLEVRRPLRRMRCLRRSCCWPPSTGGPAVR